MRTVTFYSYKGGTGRTLLLANVAVLAARMGWKVVAVDVDLEAPGLTYKLLEDPPSRCDGLVGWLRDRFATGKPPVSLGDSLLEVELTDPFEEGGWLKLMPAGRHPSLNYFEDLIGLRLEQRINDGPGVDAFVDLQNEIREELAPDLLLLDARTGISSTNLVTTRVLADDVVALTLDNREQLEGTRSVLRSLTPLTSLGTDEPLRLHVVLSRVAPRSAEIGSYAVTDEERAQVEIARAFLREPADPLRATLTVDHVHLLHAEPSLVHGDFLVLARTRVLDATALHIDCIRIAEAVLGDDVKQVAARVIAEQADPEEREQLARFFVRLDDLTAARGAALSAADAPAAGAQPDLAARVELLERVATRDPTRRPDLGRALLDLAAGEVAVGRRRDAVAPTERAVEIYEQLAAENPTFLNDLAMALNNVGIRYSEVGRRADAVEPIERAVEIYERLAVDNPAFRNDLAASLNNLGACYSEVGRRADAVTPTERALAIREELAADNPAFLNDLAMSLNNLGSRYSGVGRRADAVKPAERAVEIRERLAVENPAFLNDLAGSLNNLGSFYSEVGRRADAVKPTERAVEIYERLAVENPAILHDLAMSLNNLGIRYSEVGRRANAVKPAERAVEIYERLAVENPAFLNDLAASLNNLGAFYSEVGRRADAVTPTERAVEIYERLAVENPAFLNDLAMSLNNLGIRYSGVGRRADAVKPTERAVEIREPLAVENPAFLNDLASSLNNLGIRYSGVGRRADAVEPTERAVEIYEQLAADNPAFLNDLAMSLNNLGNRYGALGRHAEAISATRRAIDLFRVIVRELPAVGRPRLASALRALAAHLRASGDEDGALAATEESERITAALLDDA